MRQSPVADQHTEAPVIEIALMLATDAVDDKHSADRVSSPSPRRALQRETELGRSVDIGEIIDST